MGRLVASAAIALLISSGAHAQNVTNVGGVSSRATLSLKDGVYRSCGLRFVGVDIGSEQGPIRYPIHAFDFNLLVSRPGPMQMVGILKTEITKLSSSDQLRKASGPLVKVLSTWVQIEGAEPFRASKTGIPGENGLSSMNVYSDMMGIFKGLVEVSTGGGGGPTFLLGVELAGEKATRIYRFKPTIQSEDGAGYIACANSLLDQWKKDSGEK